jgi:Dullard-like phosphatase family protein
MMRKRNYSESKVSRSQGIPNNYIINKKYYNYNNNNYNYNAKEENFINNTINNTTLNTTSETQINNLNNLNYYCTPKIENRIKYFSPNSFKSKANTFVKKSISITNNIQRYFSNNNNSNNRYDNINDEKKDPLVNIEDLLLLEEKYVDIIQKITTNDVSNECFEFLNFYFNSSLNNSFENYFKTPESKNIVHMSLVYVIYNIIFSYNISFDENFFIICEDILSKLLKYHHNSYLIICEYINSKISSSEIGNLWVKRLSKKIKDKLIHLDLNNKEYLQFKMNNSNNNLPSLINELDYYNVTIDKYIRVLLKNYSNDKLNSDFFNFYKNLNSIKLEDLNKFFQKKVLRILNKNASVLGGDISFLGYEQEKITLEKKSNKKFTLVLDLDETLISFKINPKEPSNGLLRFRPGLDLFLEKMKNLYELIVFTSATEKYADIIINAIENKNKIFDYRLYRKHTVMFNGDLVKDLSKLGRDLSKIIIVDNIPQNFRFQKENGIFIKAFWGEDKMDTALYCLGDILEKIANDFSDVRQGILFYKEEILSKVSSNVALRENKKNSFF